MSTTARRPRPKGMTLIELLVVITIILILSVATLPTIVASLTEREVSEAASIVQANLSMTADRASGTGAPSGVRLLPDPSVNPALGMRAASRMVPLEPAPSYSEGEVIPGIQIDFVNPGFATPFEVVRLSILAQMAENEPNSIAFDTTLPPPTIPTAPTGWYYNIRQGDTIRLADSGLEYRIVGPMRSFTTAGAPPNGSNVINAERFINVDEPTPTGFRFRYNPVNAAINPPIETVRERLYVVNGLDDDNDGYVDEAFDGIDNDGDGVIDPGFNGLDDNGNGAIDEPLELLYHNGTYLDPRVAGTNAFLEYETESYIHGGYDDLAATTYIIIRRPYVASGSREITLPAGAVIDLTTSTLGTNSERSRVPIDLATGYVDLLFEESGRVVPSTPYGYSRAMSTDFPFYYLWIAERGDVKEPLWGFDPTTGLYGANPASTSSYLLPMPQGANAYLTDPSQAFQLGNYLTGDRRLIVISPTSGHTSVSEIVDFDGRAAIPPSGIRGIDVPYILARDSQQTGN